MKHATRSRSTRSTGTCFVLRQDPKLNRRSSSRRSTRSATSGATEELEAIEERERQRIRREEEAEKRKKAIAEKIGKKLVLQSKTTGAEKSSSPKDKPPEEALSPLPANENVGGGDDESDDNESSHSSYHAGRMTLMLEGARRMRTATQGADSDEDAANIDENSSDSSDDSSGSGFTSSDEEDKGTVGRVFSFQRADSAGDEKKKNFSTGRPTSRSSISEHRVWITWTTTTRRTECSTV